MTIMEAVLMGIGSTTLAVLLGMAVVKTLDWFQDIGITTQKVGHHEACLINHSDQLKDVWKELDRLNAVKLAKKGRK